MRPFILLLLSMFLFYCFNSSSQAPQNDIPERIAGSYHIVSSRIGKGVRTHLWVPFQLNGKYISFESIPQLSVRVVGCGKKSNGQPFQFPIQVDKIQCENDGFSLTLLSSELPVKEVDCVDINYLAMTDCKEEECLSPPPCGSCCRQ